MSDCEVYIDLPSSDRPNDRPKKSIEHGWNNCLSAGVIVGCSIRTKQHSFPLGSSSIRDLICITTRSKPFRLLYTAIEIIVRKMNEKVKPPIVKYQKKLL